METHKGEELLAQWRARARAALEQVNAGVAVTLERLADEEAGVDEAFGAPTPSERAQLEAERREVEQLEAKSRAEPAPAEKRSRSTLNWIARKVRR